MLRPRLWIAGMALWMALTLRAQAPEIIAAPPPVAPNLGYVEAVIFGLVEGITEYLPISSTGHLLLTNAWLGLDEPLVVQGDDGEPILDDDGQPYTLKRATEAYLIVIQGGAILAVILLYWRRLLQVAAGFLGQDQRGRQLGINLIVAFVPAAVLGVLFDDLIEAYLFGPMPVVIALVAGAYLMIRVDRWRKLSPANVRDLDDLTWRQALFVGLLQCVAMWPGTSRSMMTIVGGYLVGLKPAHAAEFSFLLGLITLSAASAYKGLSEGAAMMQVLDVGPMAVGLLVALVSAFLVVRWLVGYLSRGGLTVFAIYRLALAAIVLVTLVSESA